MIDFRIHLLNAILTFILLSSSCDKVNKEAAQFNSPFELEVNERILFPESSNGFSFTLTSVNDSRCPIDVNCITAGSAKVQFQLSDNSGVKASGELCIGSCDNHITKTEDTLLITLNNINYSVSLKSVNPYPNSSSTNKNKKVLFIVNHLVR